MTLVIFLWAPPRSLSTAFLRMMLERGDCFVLHEPFSSIVVEGYATVGAEKVTAPAQVVDVAARYSAGRHIFIKETTEYRYGIIRDKDFMSSATHTFLIRDPRRVIPSHYAMNSDLTLAEVGFEHQYEIFERARRTGGPVPAVVEAEALVHDGHDVVRRYCDHVGLGFIPGALSWSPGHRAVWSRTRKWHERVAGSSGFADVQNMYKSTVSNHPRLADYYRHHLPFYHVMKFYARRDAAARSRPVGAFAGERIRMPNPFDDEDAQFLVLINDEGQHSLWPVFMDVPAGWTKVYGEQGRSECLQFIEENWTDMRPNSLVRAMESETSSGSAASAGGA
jgi:uncharacterized protein YbdZ (MbtH family)